MFETRTEIRKAAREKAIEKWLEESREDGHKEGHQAGREAGERQSAERIRASLLRHGIELPPELEHELFENGSQS